MMMPWLRTYLIAAALTLFTTAGARAQRAPATPPQTNPVRAAVSADGLVADLYTPPDAKDALPAVIVLGGSEGGLGPYAAWEAWLLAAHGFAALQVSYFDGPGQSHRLAGIPLEYFKTAIDWLQHQPIVDPSRIGIMGASRGGEAALLTASHYPEIKAVVAGAPSSVVWPGIAGNFTPPAFTLTGHPLPFLTPRTESGFTSVYDLFAKGLAALDQHPDAIIPVENINGPVMLVCGEQDRLWPSCPMAHQVETRLKAAHFKFDVQLLACPDAGHRAFGPQLFDAASVANAGRPDPLGGSVAGNAAARRESWPRALAFLDAALKNPSR